MLADNPLLRSQLGFGIQLYNLYIHQETASSHSVHRNVDKYTGTFYRRSDGWSLILFDLRLLEAV